MALNKRDEGSKINSNINVTPMVDVMLVLLIIFMVVTPMLQHGMQVDKLAATNNPHEMPDADKEDAVLIAIMRDGKVFLGTDQIVPDQLAQKVKDRVASRVDKTVFIKSDARAKYGTVVEVVDNVRSAGVDQVGLLTEQKKTPGPAKAAGAGNQ
jgi:biopolymer transport protein TolR